MESRRMWMRTGTQSAMPFPLKGVDGEEWARMCYKHAEIGKAVYTRQPSTSRKAKTLWTMREAKASGEEYYDQGSGRQIESRAAVRQAMWEKALTKSLEEALRRTEEGGQRGAVGKPMAWSRPGRRRCF